MNSIIMIATMTTMLQYLTYYADTLVNVNHHSAVAVLNYVLTYYAVHLEEQNYIEKNHHTSDTT